MGRTVNDGEDADHACAINTGLIVNAVRKRSTLLAALRLHFLMTEGYIEGTDETITIKQCSKHFQHSRNKITPQNSNTTAKTQLG